MIAPLTLLSEPFAPTGNINAEGFRNLMGRPALNLLQTVVRESLQNCIDAAVGDQGPTVMMRLRTLTADQADALLHTVLPDLPSEPTSADHLEDVLTRERVTVFEICDFHTRGLAGPTRADRPTQPGEPRNFINFLRNVGAERDTPRGGGTYGYGKTSLYALSSCATIIADSLTHADGALVRRFMACHLGKAYDGNDESGVPRNYTGRHWWGVRGTDRLIEPATSVHAANIAGTLGLPERIADQTGTSVLILDPQFDSDSLEDTADHIIEAVLWNFWPRMVESTKMQRRLRVRLEVDGNELPIPRPEDFPPLDLFARALANQREGKDQIAIQSERPKTHLGNLVIEQGMAASRIGPATREESSIPTQVSHIALMRPVELIVKYLEGNAFPDENYEWAGVFTCSDEDRIEEAFAMAEPPAHDDWIPTNLPKGEQRSYVNVALTRLREQARSVVGASTVTGPTGESATSLARTAAAMGRLLGNAAGTGPALPRLIGKPGATPRKTAVSRPNFIELQLDVRGQPLAIYEAEVRNAGDDPNLKVVVDAHLVADGGRVDPQDLPDAYKVSVQSISLQGSDLESQSKMLLVGKSAGTLRIEVAASRHAAVAVRARLISGDPGHG